MPFVYALSDYLVLEYLAQAFLPCPVTERYQICKRKCLVNGWWLPSGQKDIVQDINIAEKWLRS